MPMGRQLVGVYYARGYQDGMAGAPYRQAPSQEPPRVPNECLPPEWRDYLEGWRVGVMEAVGRSLRAMKRR